MSENKEMMVVNTNDVASVDLMAGFHNSNNALYSSIKNDGTRESQIKIFNAINAAEEQLDDHKNLELSIVDVVVHPITLTDENTGEIVDTLRVVLIDDKGVGYQAVSQGIVSSLQKIFAIVGQPTWEPALKMKVVEQKTRKGFKTNTITLV